MRNVSIGTLTLVSTLLLVTLNISVNVAADEVGLGNLSTIVNDEGLSDASITPDASLTHVSGDSYTLSYPCPQDGIIHFFFSCSYQDTHAPETHTGYHEFTMEGTLGAQNPSDEFLPNGDGYTDGGDSGSNDVGVTFYNCQVNDVISITAGCYCEDTDDEYDQDSEGIRVTITLT